MTHKVIGKYQDGNVELFTESVVCTSANLEPGDVVEIDGHYVRMYRDGHTDGLRYWFITELVLEALVNSHMPAVRAQADIVLADVGALEAVR